MEECFVTTMTSYAFLTAANPAASKSTIDTLRQSTRFISKITIFKILEIPHWNLQNVQSLLPNLKLKRHYSELPTVTPVRQKS